MALEACPAPVCRLDRLELAVDRRAGDGLCRSVARPEDRTARSQAHGAAAHRRRHAVKADAILNHVRFKAVFHSRYDHPARAQRSIARTLVWPEPPQPNRRLLLWRSRVRRSFSVFAISAARNLCSISSRCFLRNTAYFSSSSAESGRSFVRSVRTTSIENQRAHHLARQTENQGTAARDH